MIEEIRGHLIHQIIPFWNQLKDKENGGFYGWVDDDLQIDKKAVKGCILNSRILWFYSNASMCLHDDSLLSYAKHAYAFLREYCMDEKNGGVYWSVAYDGSVYDKTKHTYNQAFALYALSSFYDAAKDETALSYAQKIYEVIETKCKDSPGLGYFEAFTESFEPIENEKLSENGILAQKTMNTLLHVFEAYTEFYRVTKNQEVGEKLKEILDCLADSVYHPQKHRLEVFFDRNLHSLIDLHSYGHDIEAAWLMERGLEVLQDEENQKKLTPIIRALEEEVYQRAYRNHSLLNECKNGIDKTNRIWWVQAEAMVGFLNAYQKTKDSRYQNAVVELWKFIKEFVIDKRPGSEWFWEVDETGIPNRSKPIVESWKCPYHNGRMCMEVIRRANDVTS